MTTISVDENEAGSLRNLRIGGTEVQYFVYCPRRLWWYAHGMEQEHSGGNAGQESVSAGALLHEDSYPDKARKDILVDDLLRIDFTEDGKVHEIKKSKSGEKAALYQLLYYLYYLKQEKGVVTTGVIDYPLQKRKVEVELTPQYEADLEKILAGILLVRELPVPPTVEKPMPICKECAYQELCWG